LIDDESGEEVDKGIERQLPSIERKINPECTGGLRRFFQR
jgi:hypothetical protein